MRTAVLMIFALGGIALLVLAWVSRRDPVDGSQRSDAEVVGRESVGGRVPSLGELSGFVMTFQVGRVPVGRVAVLGFWWWLGWHFFAR